MQTNAFILSVAQKKTLPGRLLAHSEKQRKTERERKKEKERKRKKERERKTERERETERENERQINLDL